MNNGNNIRDYYFILNVPSNASASEIRLAYRRLALKYHPDHHPEDPESEEKFKKISEAYSVIGNAQKRREYDMLHDTHSMVSEIFDNGVGNKYRFSGKGNRCGRSQCGIVQEATFNVVQLGQLYEIFLTPREAQFGAERLVVTIIEQRRRGYRIRIPAGVSQGTQFKAILGRDENRYIFCRITIRSIA